MFLTISRPKKENKSHPEKKIHPIPLLHTVSSSSWEKTGGMHAALRKERGSDKASGDGSTATGDPHKREVGVAGIWGVREVVYHGISPLGVQGSSRKERSA